MKNFNFLTITVIIVGLSGSLTWASPIANPLPLPAAEAAPEAVAEAEAEAGLPILAAIVTLPFIHHWLTKKLG
ncbi:hypothetical protein PUN28_006725 [Cardiocondyla obscurior]|uniref:Uncharacterized protein n=1 Tax=Cardiocondyla obscurior TaxID=286306 RepID=A0AAW2FZF7_9HYME